MRLWSDRTEIGAARFISWLAIATSKFYQWRARYGPANEHNGWVPRDFWLREFLRDTSLSGDAMESLGPVFTARQRESQTSSGARGRLADSCGTWSANVSCQAGDL